MVDDLCKEGGSWSAAGAEDSLQHTCHRFRSRDSVSMTSFPPELWYQPRYKVWIKITTRKKNLELIKKHFHRRYRHKNQMPISSKTDAMNFYEKSEWIDAPELCIRNGWKVINYFLKNIFTLSRTLLEIDMTLPGCVPSPT